MKQNDTIVAELELENWLKPFSSLNNFARTVKNEGETASGEQSSGDEKARNEYLQAYGDELPEEIQTKLWETHQTTQKQILETKAELERTQNVARKFQSEKDQALATLHKYNLTPNGTLGVPSPEETPVFQGIVQALLNQGFDKEAASKAAKIQIAMFEPLQQQMMQNVGNYINPVVQSVGNMQADNLFHAVQQSDKSGMYANADVAKGVKETLQSIIQTGGEFNQQSIQWMFDAEVGKQAREGKLQPTTGFMNTNQPQQFNTRSNFPMTGMPHAFNQPQNNQPPQASSAENARIMEKLLPHMFAGTSKDPRTKQQGGRK